MIATAPYFLELFIYFDDFYVKGGVYSFMKKSLPWYIMLILPVVGMLVFNIYPLIQTTIDSFQNSKNAFIGLVNYNILFSDAEFHQAFGNTIYMAILGVCFNIPIAFCVANMLNNIPVGKNVYKVFFLLPMVLSMVTVGTLFKYLLSADTRGIVNHILGMIGLGPYKFFNDVSSARESVVAMAIWKGLGYNIIVFFAGLQVVPRELFEAAKVDGASEWKQWLHITIPSIKNTFTFVLITSTIAALKRFTEVYAISGEYGSPAGALYTLMLYIYRNSFSTLNYKDLGRASSAAMVLFVLIFVITAINFKLTSGDNTATKQLKKRGRAK